MKNLSQHITESFSINENFDLKKLANSNNSFGELMTMDFVKFYHALIEKSPEKLLANQTISLNNDSIKLGKAIQNAKHENARIGSVAIKKGRGSFSIDVFVMLADGWSLENLNSKTRKDNTNWFNSLTNAKEVSSIDTEFKKISEFSFTAVFAPTKSSLDIVEKYDKGSLQSYQQSAREYNDKNNVKKYN